MIKFKHKGDLSKTTKFLNYLRGNDLTKVLQRYGADGLRALSAATPIDSGATANSWNFEIVSTPGKHSIYWTNSNAPDGVPIAVILQYGHGTGTGGYVEGRDYINPAIRPIFDKIADEAWREVTK